MKPVDLVSVDGLRLDAALHPATSSTVGVVIQAHGVTVDKDEGGMFVRLAESLAATGFTVVRFSFRGHGASQGTQEGVTIAGEMLDLQAAVELVRREHIEPVSIVAASFGAVPLTLSLAFIHDLRSIVLWNPVLDLHRTFLEPELPWAA
ncbi:MAG: alpha/beta hydrolase [Haloechinothrix sp.]